MATSYRFLADPQHSSEVMQWFRALNAPPVEAAVDRTLVLYFKECGPLAYDANGAIDAKASPVVTVTAPRVRRGILWTVGEVHFRATPLRKRFPVLHDISSAFSQWLAAHDCVYPSDSSEIIYYLEGSVRNSDARIFALDSGLEALRAGRYFVADDDTEFVLDKLCQSIRLRGVRCTDT